VLQYERSTIRYCHEIIEDISSGWNTRSSFGRIHCLHLQGIEKIVGIKRRKNMGEPTRTSGLSNAHARCTALHTTRT
jgi:hypothetical protein